MRYLVLLLLCTNSYAQFSYQGQIELRTSMFNEDDNSSNYDEQNSFYTRLSTNYETNHLRLKVSGFARFDSMDKSRKVSNLDEAYLKVSNESYSITMGNQVFNWSVLEFFHPVDTINPRNLDVNAERIERLGLSSIMLNKDFENSNLQLIYFLDNTDPIIPSATNRNGFGLDLTRPKYVKENGEVSNTINYNQYGIRYRHSFENFDLDIHWLRKVANNNPFIAIPVQVIIDPNVVDVSPFYFPVKQTGLTLQYIYNDYLFKFEALDYKFDPLEVETLIPTNSFPPIASSTLSPINHTQSAIGMEYTNVYNSNQEGTYFLEYQFIINTSHENAKRLNPFQKDVGIGYRHNFNDFNSNALVIAMIYDLENGSEALYNIEHSFSFQKHYKMFLNLRVIDAPKAIDAMDATGLKPLRDADNFSVAVSRYF